MFYVAGGVLLLGSFSSIAAVILQSRTKRTGYTSDNKEIEICIQPEEQNGLLKLDKSNIIEDPEESQLLEGSE